ncbi:hypothetical protein DXG01_003170 [Tephrocybe rancida]|nr:hypothetical protein DXG01_003170 [Tephrocybe rancida]
MTVNMILDVGVALVALTLYLYFKRRSDDAQLPLPPGPKRFPLIGNLLDMPKSFEWLTYHKWCQELDTDIIHLDLAGTSVIVLDNAKIATELLEKRSSIYSDRARMPMINELMGWGWNVGFMPYGDLWRHHRRLLHQEFHPSAAMRFQPHELKATHNLLRRFLDAPDSDLMENLRHMAGDTIMAVAYGIDVQPIDDPYVAIAARGVFPLLAAAVPGAFLVDSIPILKYVPDWMPFADFKRKAKEWRRHALDMVNMPFEAAKHNIEKGTSMPSFTSSCLEQMDESGDLKQQESIIKGTAGTMYTAGSDTTVAIMGSCVLGLLTNPAALRKAQEEIDRVVGPKRLPTFDDVDSLPYITAIAKEALRWRDVTPMVAVPHMLHEDDEYNGYRLPKGSIIIANAWAMLHDENIYPCPFEFDPDRFMKGEKLDPDAKDPSHAAFGFGRRICPGRYMAFSAIWIAVASIAATYDITKARDANGDVIEPSHEYSSTLAWCVLKLSTTSMIVHANDIQYASTLQVLYNATIKAGRSSHQGVR